MVPRAINERCPLAEHGDTLRSRASLKPEHHASLWARTTSQGLSAVGRRGATSRTSSEHKAEFGNAQLGSSLETSQFIRD